MEKIEWKNGITGGTPLQGEVGRFVWHLWELGYIKDGQPINAEFMNKYHFEILLEDYKNGKSIEEIGKLLEEE
jgi:hypothetical protein